MRNILGNILFCCVLTLCMPTFALAQAGGYDEALDKYANICDRCVEMRARAEAGQSVSEASLKSLLEELVALRKTLSGASGRMSPAQLSRFEAIKARYNRNMKSPKESLRLRTEPLPRLSALPVDVIRRGLVPSPASGSVEAPGKSPLYAASTNPVSHSDSQGLEISVLVDAGMFPKPSFGASAVATWNGVGAYATFRSDFSRNEYSYSCSSDGSTEYGRIWTTGRSRESRTVATAGLAMFTSRRFGFRLGAGLTSYTRSWEDVSGLWAKVSDKSFSGFAVDGGVYLAFRPLLVSVGATSDFFGHVDLQLGLGLCF